MEAAVYRGILWGRPASSELQQLDDDDDDDDTTVQRMRVQQEVLEHSLSYMTKSRTRKAERPKSKMYLNCKNQVVISGALEMTW